MLKKIIIILLPFLPLFCLDYLAATAADSQPVCSRLQEKANGDLRKYSLQADVDGLLFFSGISCAVRYRNKELCAMEMVSFDTTAKVYDYYSKEEIAIGRAAFWIDEKDDDESILAFSTREKAEKYGAAAGRGNILDYTALTERLLK